MHIPLFAIPLIVWFIIQITKLVIDFFEEKKFDISFFFRAWWFPSVHSWVSSSLLTIIFLQFGYESAEFAITLIFSFLFWYDAMNVRYEAWKHAKFINKLNFDLQNVLKIWSEHNSLKERLWHTLSEVTGWIIIWSILTIVIYYFILK